MKQREIAVAASSSPSAYASLWPAYGAHIMPMLMSTSNVEPWPNHGDSTADCSRRGTRHAGRRAASRLTAPPSDASLPGSRRGSCGASAFGSAASSGRTSAARMAVAVPPSHASACATACALVRRSLPPVPLERLA
eukprot:4589619-Prymnesium_polylepis.1